MFLASLPAISVVTAIFTAIHAWVQRSVEPEFNRAFRLSRGIAAVALTVVGFIGFALVLPEWKQAFILRHDSDDLLLWGVIIAYGHLLSDFIWMAWGRIASGINPRMDLLFHHGLGALAYGYAMHIEVGYGIVMVTLASEIMPCFTGLEAFGKYKDDPGMQQTAARARLLVLMFWRIPLWATCLGLSIWNLSAGGHTGELEFAYQFATVALVLLLCLDLYWLKKCLPAWRTS